METHPIADIWPLMPEDKIAAMAEDIRRNGLINPIWIYQDKILDGRNRWLACEQIGIQPETKTYTGNDPARFAFSLNEERRHLSAGQRAALAVELMPILREEAKTRQGYESVQEKIPELNKGQSRDHAAATTGTNGKYVDEASKIKKQAPEVFKELKSGRVSMQDAMREVRKKPTDPWTQDEKDRKHLVELGQSVIANAEKDKNLIQWADKECVAVQIGRNSPYGNPFVLDKDGDRDTVCDLYRDNYLPFKPSILKALKELNSGRVLICHCYPERCHGDDLLGQGR